MKQFLAIALSIAFVAPSPSLVATAWAGDDATFSAGASSVTVRTVSVVPTSGRAQVVIGVDATVEVDDFVLEAPYRIVIDLKGARLDMAPRYDKHTRGGVTNIRAAQFKPNVVRVVIEMDASHPYEVSRADGEVRVDVSGGVANFDAWHSSPGAAARDVASTTESSPVTTAAPASTRAPPAFVPVSAASSTTPDANITSDSPSGRGLEPSTQLRLSAPTLLSDQPRITVTYQDADIRDVIAAFASFSGRTIVVGKDVQGTITAEIKNQPWDVALRAILQGQGLAAAEDALSGIITVDSYKNIAAKQSTEPVVTQLVAVNYASAASLVQTLTGLLAKDCTQNTVVDGRDPRASCFSRGAVAADTATNTLLITETPSRMADLLSYVKSLDVRTPQVAIKAKIIFVNRTDIEELGLSYDLGTGSDQFFSQLVQRIDPTTTKPVDTNGDGVPDAFGGGSPINGDRILIGGNALSAIANANARVVNPALKLVFSAALGKFQLTSFLDASSGSSSGRPSGRAEHRHARQSQSGDSRWTGNPNPCSRSEHAGWAAGRNGESRSARHGSAQGSRNHPERHAAHHQQPADPAQASRRELRCAARIVRRRLHLRQAARRQPASRRRRRDGGYRWPDSHAGNELQVGNSAAGRSSDHRPAVRSHTHVRAEARSPHPRDAAHHRRWRSLADAYASRQQAVDIQC